MDGTIHWHGINSFIFFLRFFPKEYVFTSQPMPVLEGIISNYIKSLILGNHQIVLYQVKAHQGFFVSPKVNMGIGHFYIDNSPYVWVTTNSTTTDNDNVSKCFVMASHFFHQILGRAKAEISGDIFEWLDTVDHTTGYTFGSQMLLLEK